MLANAHGLQTSRLQPRGVAQRLLFIGNFLSAGGGKRSPIEDLADRLGERGYSMLCASDASSGWMRGIDMISRVWKSRSGFDAAVVDLYSGRAFLWGEGVSLALRFLGRPFVLSLHGGNLPGFAKRWPRRVRSCLRRATVVQAPSAYLAAEMKQYRADILELPNPIEISHYIYRARPAPRPRLVWLRAFEDLYNPVQAVDVLAKLAEDFPDASLAMYGPVKSPPSRVEVERRAAELQVPNRLELPGPLTKSEIPAALDRGDIFLNTTNADNAPVSVLEAMASGMCIVSTNVGGLPHLLKDGENALLVPPNNAPAMVAAVHRVLREPGLARRLSENARKKAEQFDWQTILPRWEDLLSGLPGLYAR